MPCLTLRDNSTSLSGLRGSNLLISCKYLLKDLLASLPIFSIFFWTFVFLTTFFTGFLVAVLASTSGSFLATFLVAVLAVALGSFLATFLVAVLAVALGSFLATFLVTVLAVALGSFLATFLVANFLVSSSTFLPTFAFLSFFLIFGIMILLIIG